MRTDVQSCDRGDNARPLVSAAGGGAVSDGAAAQSSFETWVVFLLDEQKYALQMEEVERIVRAVEVKPLPQSPPHVLGIVNMQGRILPVINLRLLFKRPLRDIRLEDHFIVARTSTISAILPVDAALGSLEVVDTTDLPNEKARDKYLRKIVPFHEEVVYTVDLERVVFADQAPEDSDLTSMMAGLETA